MIRYISNERVAKRFARRFKLHFFHSIVSGETGVTDNPFRFTNSEYGRTNYLFC